MREGPATRASLARGALPGTRGPPCPEPPRRSPRDPPLTHFTPKRQRQRESRSQDRGRRIHAAQQPPEGPRAAPELHAQQEGQGAGHDVTDGQAFHPIPEQLTLGPPPFRRQSNARKTIGNARFIYS